MSRDKFFIHSQDYISLSKILRNLSFALHLGLLASVPALMSGCTGEELPSDIGGHRPSAQQISFSCGSLTSQGSTLDIFAFEYDRMCRMDSYQRIENFDGKTAAIGSTGGSRIFFFCLNSHKNRYDWSSISSYQSLKKLTSELENETAANPTMTGELRIQAGSSTGEVTLQRLAGEVAIETIGCDFSGTSYADKALTDIKAYLINVSGSCPITTERGDRPTRIINCGMLCPEDIRKFTEPGILYREVADRLYRDVISPGIRLTCYPNTVDEESPGAPFTRLVIEGRIGSETYYWPININHTESSENHGIERNCSYIYNILITRKGSTDPDIPVSAESVTTSMKVKPWTEKKEYTIGF